MRRSSPLLIAIALSATVVPAAAAPAWLAPRTVSPDTGEAVLPSAGVDATGAVTVVWHQSSFTAQSRIMAVTRPAGGEWGAAQAISAEGAAVAEVPAPAVFDPALAVAPDGRAVAVWRYRDGGGYVVEAAVRPPGGEWGAPQVISRAARRHDAPVVAVDPDGDAMAAWVRHGQSGMTVEAVVRPAAGGWSAPVTISAPGATEVTLPSVGLGADGTAVAAWAWRGGPGDLWRVQGATRAAGAAWSAARDISETSVSAPVPAVALGGEGTGWVAWDREVGTGKVAEAAAHGPGGAWGKPERLTDADGNAGAPDLELLADGRVALATATGTGPATARVTIRVAGPGGWGAPEVIGTPAELAVGPRLAAVPGGLAIAWDGCPQGGACRVRAARRDGSGAWTPADPPDPGMSLGGFAADPAGNAVAVGTRYQDVDPAAVVQAVAFDAAGPDLRTAAVPATAVAGTQVNMSVAPLDVWSALSGAPSWDFGDGSPPAAGQGVTHTFAAPGDYTVTVTQSDALGIPSVERRTIAVTAPPEIPVNVSVLRVARGVPGVGGVRAVCAGPASRGCRVQVTFTLPRAQRVTVRVALRGRAGHVVVTMRARRGTNRLTLPARIGGIPLRPGVRLAVTVRGA